MRSLRCVSLLGLWAGVLCMPAGGACFAAGGATAFPEAARCAIDRAQSRSGGTWFAHAVADAPRYLVPAGLAAGFAVLLIASLMAWNRTLKRAIRQRTEALAESELRFRQLAEHIRDVFWITTPAMDEVLYCSPMYEAIWGRSLDSLYAEPKSSIDAIQPASRDKVIAAIAGAVDQGFEVEYPIDRPDGTTRWIRDRGFPIRDASGSVYRIVGICQDLTEQKKAERELRDAASNLEGLSRRLVRLQESERKKLARELHDRVGQYLTALNINLSMLSTQFADHSSEKLRARLADSEVLIEATAAAVRSVVAELRPPMLDDHGLIPALEWYAANVATRTGLSIVVRGPESADHAAADVEIALFRIAQEALNNVAKHAAASQVDIYIERSSAGYLMTIEDDGLGFDPASSDGTWHAGLGLVTMRERAQAVDGSFELHALPLRGTRLSVRAPAP